MGDSAPNNPKSYTLNDFKPDNEAVDKSTVLGTSGDISTETDEIPWEHYGRELDGTGGLVSFRDSIDSTSVQELANTWRTHGDTLTSLAGKFSNEVKSTIVHSWDSTGGESASTAVQRYADQLGQLPAIIEGIANSLEFTAKFLELTKKNIPSSDGKLADGTSIVQTSGQYDNDQTRAQLKKLLTDRAHEVMNQVFVAGGKSADMAMPIFPLPQPVTSGLPDPMTGRTGQPAQPGQPGMPGTPGTPGLTPSNYSQQADEYAKQQAQQQKELEAQQKKQLEQQQQQQEQQQKQQEQQQKQQEQQTQQQEQQQQVQQATQALEQGLQQGMQAAQQIGQQFAQKSAQTDAGKLLDGLENPAVAGLAASALNGLGGGAGGGGGGGKGLGLGTQSPLSSELAASSKLFPRASTTSALGETVSGSAKAGLASSSSGMGMPGMGPMGAAQRGNQNDKEKKRAEFLDSEEWLDQAMGNAPVTAKPVVD